jgi:hypothetical protein
VALFGANQQLIAQAHGNVQKVEALNATLVQNQAILAADTQCCNDNQVRVFW